MPRLGSKKSRNGCRQCKRRRVKCDEQSPCSNCIKHGAECSLSFGIPVTLQPRDDRPSRTLSPQSSSHSSANALSDAVIPSTPAVNPTSDLSIGATDTWVEDLQLMHHYTAHAHLTIPGNDQARQTWGFLVTQEAFQHNFLLHCILGFAALHLSHIEPRARSRHRIRALTHQAAAIAGLNSELPNITSSNCHAFFAATSLITLNAFAESTSNTKEALLGIFQLIRGVNVILEDKQETISNGPFKLIFQHAPDPSRPLPPLLSSCIVQLRTLMEDTRLHSPIAFTAAHHLLESLQSGIDSSAHIAMRAVMLWAIKVEQGFLDAVEAGQDENAARVMQQYLRIINLAGSEFWFMSSWRNIL